jgi:autotransporter-associated beta strand protein/parallel beta-helix repeat protein
MFSMKSIRKWFQKKSRTIVNPPANAKRKAQLNVENLEVRVVPSTNNIWLVNGSSSANWNFGSSWSLNHVPKVGEIAEFSSAHLAPCTININTVACDGIQIDSGYTSAITASTASTTFTLGSAGFVQSGGTFSVTMPGVNIKDAGPWTENTGSTFTAGTSTVTLNGTSNQSVGGTASTTFNNVTLNNATGATLNQAETVSGALTLTSGTLDMNGNALPVGSVTGTGTVTDGGAAATFTVNNSSADSFAGTLTGNLALAVNGAGTLTLTSGNTYSGATTVSNTATLADGIANALPTTTTLSEAGVFDLHGFGQQVAGLTGSGLVTDLSTAATLTVTNSGTDAFAGKLAGTLALTMSGAGTLTLSNSGSSYTGQTTINSGTLSVSKVADGGNNSSLGAPTGGNATILLGGGTAATLQYTGGTDSSNRPITINGSGGGTIQATAAGTLTLSGGVSVGSSSAAFDANTGNISETGALSGSGIVNKTGSGALTLSGDSSGFSGTTNVDSGALQLSGGNLGGSVNVNSKLDVNGSGTVGGLVVNSGGTVEPGDLPAFLTAASADFSAGGTLDIHVPGFGIPGTAYDQLNVSGTLTVGGTSTLNLDLGGLTTDGTATSIVTFGSISGGTFHSVTTSNATGTPNIKTTYNANSIDVAIDAPLTDASTTATYNATENVDTGDLVVATFNDGNASATTSDYSAVTIHWGDGMTTTGTVQAHGGGGFDVHGHHTYAQEGNYFPTAAVTDVNDSTLTGIGQAKVVVADLAPTVAPNAPAVSGPEQGPATNSGTYGDYDDTPVSVSGSGVTDNHNGTWNWSGTAPDEHSPYTVTVTAVNSDGTTATTVFTVNGTDVNPNVAANSASVSGPENGTATNSGTYSDVDDPVSVSGPGVTDLGSGHWSWSGSAPDEGSSYSVTVTATNADGSTNTTVFTVHGTDVSPSVTASSASVGAAEAASATNTGSFADFDDVVTSVAVISGPGSVTSFTPGSTSGSWNWSGTADEGTYTVVIEATNQDGSTGTTSFTATFSDAAPVVNLSGPNTANEVETKHYTYTTTDPGAGLDTDSYALVSVSGGTGGQVSNSVFDSNTGHGSFDVTFTAAGPTTVSVQVQEAGGALSNVSSINVNVSAITPTTVYVNKAWNGFSNGQVITDADPNTPGNQTGVYGVNAFSTIQAGVNAVATSGTVDVFSGVYQENVTVGRAMSLVGPNSGTAGRASRASEAEVLTSGNQNAVFTVSASNVSIDGFYLEGNDPAVTGSTLASGVDSNALYGVLASGAPSHLTVENSIVKDVFVGVRGDGASTGSLITRNWLDSIGNFDFGYGVTLRTDFYADVTNNLMTHVWTGVHLNNFHNAGGPATWTIAGNEIHSYAGGLLYWLQYGSATPLTFDSNQISAETGAVANNFGILMVSIQNSLNPSFTNNTITGTNYGVGLTNVSTSNTITLGATNSIVNTTLAGVYLTDNLTFNPIGTTNLTTNSYTGPANAIAVNVAGLPISAASGYGVEVQASRTMAADVSTTATISGNTQITTGGTGTGVFVTGAAACANIHDNNSSIQGNVIGIDVNSGSATVTNNHIYNTTTGIRFTSGGSGSVTSNNFAGTTNNNTDVRFDSSTGTVTFGAGNSFAGNEFYIDNQSAENFDLTSGSTFSQTGVDANFRIEDRIFHKVDDLAKGLVTWVAGNLYVTAPGTHSTGSSDTDSSIQRGIEAASSGNTVNVEAGTFTGDLVVDKSLTLNGAQAGIDPGTSVPATESVIMGTGANAPIEINSGVNNVTINGFDIKSPAGGSGALNGGIWTNGSTGITVEDNVIRNNTAGVAIGDSAVSVQHNLIQNNNAPGAGAGNGVEFFASTSQTSAVSNNHFTGNTNADVLLAAGAPISNVTISSNTLTSSAGIDVFQASSVLISSNSASAMTSAAVYVGGGDSNIEIAQNTLSNNPGQAAIMVDDAYSVGANTGINIHNNFLDSNQFGVDATSAGLGSLVMNVNHIAGNTTAGLENDPSTTVNASNNWWGSADGPNTSLNSYHPNNPAGDIVIGPATIAPWLADGVDSQPDAGFQHANADATAPVVSTTDQSATEGAPASIPLGSFTDPVSASGQWQVTVSWGDSTQSQETVSPAGTIPSLTHTYAEEGPYTVSVLVTDGSGNAGSSSFTAHVADAALTANSFTPPVATEGAPFSGTIFNFSDADPNKLVSDYSALVTLGDGNTVILTSTASANGQIVAHGDGTFDVNLSYTYSEELTGQTFSVVVTDHTSQASASTSTFSVADAALTTNSFTPPVATEGALFSGTIFNFSDADPGKLASDYTALVTLGDGNTVILTSTASANGQIVAHGDGTFDVNLSYTYGEELTGQTFSVVVTDHTSQASASTSTFRVTDAALTANSFTPPAATEGASFSGTIFNFSDADPSGTASDYTALVTLGDGNSVILTSTASGNGQIMAHGDGTFDVNLSYTYSEELTGQTFSVLVTDHNSQTSASTSTFSVADADLTTNSFTPPVATEGAPFSGTIFNFSDADPSGTASDYTALVTLGDGNSVTLTSTASANGQIVAHGNGTFDVNLIYTYAEELSNKTFSVVVTDHNSQTSASTSTFSVADADLAGASTATAAGGIEGAGTSGNAATLSGATFTDANAAAPASDFTVTSVDWGDGSHDTTGLTVTGSGGHYTVNGSHLYGEEGPYNFSITVTDHGGQTATITGSASVADQMPIVTADHSSVSVPENTSATNTGTFVDYDDTFPMPADPTKLTASSGTVSDTGGGTWFWSGSLPDGASTITITATNSDNSSSTTTFTVLVSDVAPFVASNNALVTNGGFETGDLTGWTFTPNTDSSASATVITAPSLGQAPHTGLYQAALTGDTTLGSLSQNISTIPGHAYTFSWYLASDGNTPNEFQVSWNGSVISDLTDIPLQGYTLYSFSEMATTSSTPIQLGFRNDIGFLYLDDVSVTPATAVTAPENTVAHNSGTFDDFDSAVAISLANGSPGTVTQDNTHGTWSWSGTGDEDHPYTVTLLATNADGTTSTTTFAVAFTDVAPVVAANQTSMSAVENTAVSNTGTFSDDDPVTISVLGGGSVTQDNAHGTWSWSDNSGDEGTRSITILATNDDGPPSTATTVFSVTVTDATLSGGSSSATATGGVEGVTAATLNGATFSDANTAAPIADFSVLSVNWGDGPTINNPGGFTFSGSGGSYAVHGSHLYGEEQNSYSFTIVVQDEGSAPGTNTVTITGTANVADAGLTGTNAATATGGVEGATAATLSGATFADANTGAAIADFSVLSVNWGDGPTINNPSAFTFGGSAGSYTVSGSHLYSETGPYSFVIVVKDVGGQTATINGSTTIGEAALHNGTGGTSTGGVEGSFPSGTPAALSGATFTDDNLLGPSTDYHVVAVNWGDGTSDPSGMTITGNHGTFTVQGSHLYASEEGTPFPYPYQYTITVQDETGNTTTVTGLATVADQAPLVSADQPAVGAPETMAATNTGLFSDYDDGVSLAASQGSVIDNGDGTWTWSGTGDEDHPYTVTITATNGDSTTSSTTFAVSFTDVPPTVAANSTSVTATEGSSANNTGTFHDFDDPVTLSASTGTVTPGGGGSWSWSGTAAEEGTFSVTITATNDHGLSNTTAFSVTASDAALTAGALTPPAATEGAAFGFTTVFHFTDADPSGTASDYTATVNTGDATLTSSGNPTQVQVVANGGGFDVQLAYTYAEELSGAPFSVSVTDNNASTGASDTVTVADAALTAGALTPPAATEGSAFGFTTVFHFTDANPNATASDYTASVNTGAATLTSTGNPTEVQIVANGGGFDVQLAYTYAEELSGALFSVSVTDHNASTGASGTVTVADAALTAGALTPPTATEGAAFGFTTVFHFTDANPSATASDYTATVNTGDATLTSTGNPTDVQVVANAGGFDVQLAYTYAEELSGAPFSVAVTDHNANTGASGTVTVADAALTAGALTPPTAIEAAAFGFTTVFHFTDADPNGTAGDYTATVNTGDATLTSTGNPTEVQVVANGGGFDVQLAYTYAEELSGAPFSVSVVDHNASTGASGTVTVADAALTGSAGASGINGVEGIVPSVLSSATFTDADHGASAGPFTVLSVDWGDGSHDATGLTISGGSGNYTVNGSHQYAGEEGSPYHFSITVKDEGGSTATITGSATVVDQAPSITVDNASVNVPETTLTGNTGTFGDFDDPVTLSASLGNVIDNHDGTWTWTPSDEVANAPVTITATNSDGSHSSVTFTANVTDAAPILAEIDHTVVTVPENTTATNAGAFQDFDDGMTISADKGTLIDLGNGFWSWSGTGDESSPYTVTVTAQNVDSTNEPSEPVGNDVGVTYASTTTTFVVNFTDVAPTVVANSTSVTATESGTATNTGTFHDYDDSVTLTASTGTVTPGAGTWSWSGNAGEEGTFSVTITATNADHTTTTTSFSVTVSDAALTAGALTPPSPTQDLPFGPVTVFHFSDTDPNAAVGDYTAVINLGDGNTLTVNSAGTVSGPAGASGRIVVNGGGGFDVQMSYTYLTQFDSAPFSVTVTDHSATASASGTTGILGVATWTGNASSDWNDPNNWSPGFVPGATANHFNYDVTIPHSILVSRQPLVSTPVQIRDLIVDSTATLTLAGNNLTVTHNFTNQGTVIADGNETTALTQDGTEGTWEYVGDGLGHSFNLPFAAYNNLLIADSHASGCIFVVNSPITVNGTTAITGGTLKLGAVNALSSTTDLTLNGTGVLDMTGENQTIGSLDDGGLAGGTVMMGGAALKTGDTLNTHFGGVLTGTGGNLELQGSGIFTVSGANNYTGTTTIDNGNELLALGADNAVPAGGLIVNGNGSFDLAGHSDTVGALSGNGSVTLDDGVSSSNTLTIGDNSLTANFSGTISGGFNTESVVKTGSGTQTLSGTSSYPGSTTVSQGVLVVSANNALGGQGPVTVVNGGTLALSGSINYSSAQALTLNGTGTSGAGALENLSGNNIWKGSINLASSSTINTAAGSLQLRGVISGGSSVTLTKDGPGTLTLANTNAYTGPTVIDLGTLSLTGANAIATSSGVTFMAGAILDISSSSQSVGTLTSAGSSSITLGSKTLIVNESSPTAYNGNISGTGGGLTLQGGGTLTLGGTNTYSGGTLISNGTLQLGSNTGLSASSAVTLAVTPSADLDLNGKQASAASLSNGTAVLGSPDSASVLFNGGTLTVGGTNASAFYDGLLVGASGTSLIKQGTGTFYLSNPGNSSNFFGSLMIEGGYVIAARDGALGAATADGISVTNTGAALTFAKSLAYTTAEPLSLNGVGVSTPQVAAMNYNSGALTGNIGSFAGPITLAGDSLIQSAGILGPQTFSVTGTIDLHGHQLSLGGGANSWVDNVVKVTGTISDSVGGGSLTTLGKTVGTTTTILTGNSTYAGTTTVATGTTLTVDGSTLSTGSVVVNGTGVLSGTGSVGNISGTGTVHPGDPIAPTLTSYSIGTLSATSADFSGGGTLYAAITGTSGSPMNDVLNLSGALTLGGSSKLTVDLSGLSSNAPLSSVTYNIVNYGSFSGDFSSKTYVNQGSHATPTTNETASNYQITAADVGASWSSDVPAPAGVQPTLPAAGMASSARPMTVAVLDTGIDFSNKALLPNIWINQAEIPAGVRGNLVDVYHDGFISFRDLQNPINQGPGKIEDVYHDGYISVRDLLAPFALGGWATGLVDPTSGYVDDIVGWNFVDNNNNPYDHSGHGTYSASLVAAVDPSAVIMPLQILNSSGLGSLDAATAALNFALDHGAQVTLNAWVPDALTPAWTSAVARAQGQGELVVMAAGNDNAGALDNLRQMHLSNVVIVGAVDSGDQMASFSNRGAGIIDLAAPGVDIIGLVADGRFEAHSGTSVSAALVAGEAALAWGLHPTLSDANIVTALFAGADRVQGLDGSVAEGRVLNFAGTLAAAAQMDQTGLVVTSEVGQVAAAPVAAAQPATTATVAALTKSTSPVTLGDLNAATGYVSLDFSEDGQTPEAPPQPTTLVLVAPSGTSSQSPISSQAWIAATDEIGASWAPPEATGGTVWDTGGWVVDADTVDALAENTAGDKD